MTCKSAIGLMLALVVCGCESTPSAPPPRRSAPPPGAGSGRSLSIDEVFPDACGVRLHNLCDLLLLYYADHKQLPDQLADLQPLADPGTTLSLTNPVSGLPFGYAPAGLVSPSDDRMIIVFDSAPTDGKRWCILWARPHNGALGADVLQIPEGLFRTYFPRGP